MAILKRAFDLLPLRPVARRSPSSQRRAAVEIGVILLAGAMVLVRRQPAWFFGLAVLAFVIASLEPGFARIEQVRSFFGVHRAVEDVEHNWRLLLDGTTLHGAESATISSCSTRSPPMRFPCTC
jgi:hypothetical protein